MRKIAQLCVVALLTTMSAAMADANIVLDDFSSFSAASDSRVTRTVAGSTGFVSGLGFVFGSATAGEEIGRIQYQVNGGETFGEAFGSMAGGFAIDTLTASSDFSLRVVGFTDMPNLGSPDNGRTVLYDQTMATETVTSFDDLSVFKFLRFRIFRSGGTDSALVGGEFSAVPEPTSLILVGIACTGMILRRSRI